MGTIQNSINQATQSVMGTTVALAAKKELNTRETERAEIAKEKEAIAAEKQAKIEAEAKEAKKRQESYETPINNVVAQVARKFESGEAHKTSNFYKPEVMDWRLDEIDKAKKFMEIQRQQTNARLASLKDPAQRDEFEMYGQFRKAQNLKILENNISNPSARQKLHQPGANSPYKEYGSNYTPEAYEEFKKNYKGGK